MGLGLQIEVEELEHKLVLRMKGRIDASSALVLERKIQQLMDENHKQLILDFSEVDYLSSAGMRVLFAATKKLTAKKGNLVLFSLNEEVAEIVRMAGFDKILHLCATEQEALQFFR
ncbi:MAG: STAS domain-containing protein [Verrucomicrobiota bacterium]|nr:STAS domain-containing protein [Verrucomicrobiota bacterium]